MEGRWKIKVNYLFQSILGKLVQRPAQLDETVAADLLALARPEDPYSVVTGRTMCTYDFYEGTVLFAGRSV